MLENLFGFHVSLNACKRWAKMAFYLSNIISLYSCLFSSLSCIVTRLHVSVHRGWERQGGWEILIAYQTTTVIDYMYMLCHIQLIQMDCALHYVVSAWKINKYGENPTRRSSFCL